MSWEVDDAGVYRCATFRPPPAGSSDGRAIAEFRRFLAEVDRRGVVIVSGDVGWLPYLSGKGPPPAADAPTPCPVCGAGGGFHDDGPHQSRAVPRELAYTRHPDDAGGASWRRPDGLPLPHRRDQ